MKTIFTSRILPCFLVFCIIFSLLGGIAWGASYADMAKVDMTVKVNGKSVTSFNSNDKITLEFSLTSSKPMVESLCVINTKTDDQYFLYTESINISNKKVTVTLDGLYEGVYNFESHTTEKGAVVPNAEYFFVVWDDSVGEYGKSYASSGLYTVGGGSEGGESTVVKATWDTADIVCEKPAPNATTSFTFTLAPSVDFVFNKDSELRFVLNNVDFSNATLEGDDFILSTKGHGLFLIKFPQLTTITKDDGFTFTINGAVNPPFDKITGYIAPTTSTVTDGNASTIYKIEYNTVFDEIKLALPKVTVNLGNNSNTIYPSYNVTVGDEQAPRFTSYTFNTTFNLSFEDLGKKIVVDILDSATNGQREIIYSVEIPSAQMNNTFDIDLSSMLYEIVLVNADDEPLPLNLFDYKLLLEGEYCHINGSTVMLPNEDCFDKLTLILTPLVIADTLTYDLSETGFAVDGNTLKIVVKDSIIGSVCGTVTDEGGNPIENATVTVSQEHNGFYFSYNVSTNRDGEYTIDDCLVLGAKTDFTVFSPLAVASESRSVASFAGEDESFTLNTFNTILYVKVPKGIHQYSVASLEVTKDESLVSSVTTYNDGMLLIIGVQGNHSNSSLEIKLDKATKAVQINEDGVGSTAFTYDDIEVFGSIDFSGIYTQYGRRNIKAYLFSEKARYVYTATSAVHMSQSTIARAGVYEIVFTAGQNKTFDSFTTKEDLCNALDEAGVEYIVKTFDIVGGEITVLQNENDMIVVPDSRYDSAYPYASVYAPYTVGIGKTFKITGTVKSKEALASLGVLVPFNYLNCVQSITVNNKPCRMSESTITGNYSIHADLEGLMPPYKYTIHMYANVDRNGRDLLGETLNGEILTVTKTDDVDLLAGFSTRVVPDLTLNVPNRSESKKGIVFSGNAHTNSKVTIYDNGTPVANVTAKHPGVFIGTFDLASDYYSHEISAVVEFEYDGEMQKASVSKSLDYVPGEAVLSNINGIVPGSLPRSYIPNNSAKTYTAEFINPSMLSNDYRCMCSDGKVVEGKVFFRVTTVNGNDYYLPTKEVSGRFTATYDFGYDYPVAVKALYSSRQSSQGNAVTKEYKETIKDYYVDDDGNQIEYTFVDSGTVTETESVFAQEDMPVVLMSSDSTEDKMRGIIALLVGDDAINRYSESPEAYVSKVFESFADGSNDITAVSKDNIGFEGSKENITVTLYTDYLKRLPAQVVGFNKHTICKGADKLVTYSRVSFYNKQGRQVSPTKSYFLPADSETNTPAHTKTVPNPDVYSILQTTYKATYTGNSPAPLNVIRDRLLVCLVGAKSPLKPDEPGVLLFDVGGEDEALLMASDNVNGLTFKLNPKDFSTDTWVSIGTTALSSSFGIAGNITKKAYVGEATLLYNRFKEAAQFSVNLSDLSDMVGNGISVVSFFSGLGPTSEDTKTKAMLKLMDDMRDDLVETYKSSENTAIKNEIKNMLTDFGTTGDVIAGAQTQNEFTKSSTPIVDLVGTATGFIPGWGWAGASALGAGSAYLKAANDTRSKEAYREFEKLFNKYKALKDKHIKDLEKKLREKQEKEEQEEQGETGNTGGGEDDKPDDEVIEKDDNVVTDNKEPKIPEEEAEEDVQETPVHDPSGYVYEAVASNRIEGATVILYQNGDYLNYVPTYDGVAEGVPTNADTVKSGRLVMFDDTYGLQQKNPLITDSQGRYAWDVPQGLWYVSVIKEGYERASSQNDPASVVVGGEYNWLPVLPPQLDVNIALVNYDTPKVIETRAVEDGVYITFDKYMDENTLVAESFILADENGEAIEFAIEKLDSEASPTNEGVSYTSKIKLNAELEGISNVTIIAENAESYSGVKMERCEEAVSVTPPATYTIKVSAKPTKGGSVTGGGKVKENESVTVTATPKSNYVFTGWSENGAVVSTSRRYTIENVRENHTLVAGFSYIGGSGGSSGGGSSSSGGSVVVEVVYHDITAKQTEGGKIYPASARVAKGASASFEIKADEGYTLSDVIVDGKSIGAVEKYTFSKVAKNSTISAVFTKIEEPAVVVEEWINPFEDVSESDWFYKAVKYASSSKLMNGVSTTRFAPNEPLTRAMFVTVLYRMEGEPETEIVEFDDVVKGAWYEKAVSWASRNGIVNGVSKTEFAPQRNITREQMATIMFRYAKTKGIDTTTEKVKSYTDADEISSYATEAVNWASGIGLMSGNPDGTFAPKNNSTRAQAATVFQRCFEKLAKLSEIK